MDVFNHFGFEKKRLNPMVAGIIEKMDSILEKHKDNPVKKKEKLNLLKESGGDGLLRLVQQEREHIKDSSIMSVAAGLLAVSIPSVLSVVATGASLIFAGKGIKAFLDVKKTRHDNEILDRVFDARLAPPEIFKCNLYPFSNWMNEEDKRRKTFNRAADLLNEEFRELELRVTPEKKLREHGVVKQPILEAFN